MVAVCLYLVVGFAVILGAWKNASPRGRFILVAIFPIQAFILFLIAPAKYPALALWRKAPVLLGWAIAIYILLVLMEVM